MFRNPSDDNAGRTKAAIAILRELQLAKTIAVDGSVGERYVN
jgi:hypothetical protein